MVWISVNRITVDSPAEADEIVERFRRRPKKVDQRPGFLALEVWREGEGKEVLVMTRWARKEDFEAWLESPAFREAHRGAQGSPGQAHGTLYEVVL
jgi:heme-degrading monooxygenase HmoA